MFRLQSLHAVGTGVGNMVQSIEKIEQVDSRKARSGENIK